MNSLDRDIVIMGETAFQKKVLSRGQIDRLWRSGNILLLLAEPARPDDYEFIEDSLGRTIGIIWWLEWISVKQAASVLCDVSPQLVYKLFRTGEIAGVKIGKSVRLKNESVHQLLWRGSNRRGAEVGPLSIQRSRRIDPAPDSSNTALLDPVDTIAVPTPRQRRRKPPIKTLSLPARRHLH
jgi:excisionase family DNA binding protein